MFCRYCGGEIADDSAFCQHCGKNLKEAGSNVQQTKAPQPERTAKPLIDPVPKQKPKTMQDLVTPKNGLYLLLAIVCMIPLGFAEYRRLVDPGVLDGTYWLLASPVLLSVWFLYLIVGVPAVEETKQKDQEEYEKTGYYCSHVFETVCNVLFGILMPLAIVCFIISGIVQAMA